jgi:S1-C subfamily serine protease
VSAVRGFRFVLVRALSLVAALLPGTAGANLIPDSLTQVGSWRVGAYTRGTTSIFDHCSLYRVQADGFGVGIGLSPKGIWTLALEAPDWGLTPQELYTTAIGVGTAGSYTSTGRAVSARVMTLDVAPEIFPQLKTGVMFSATANHHRYTISLDGIEAASSRVRECVRQYASQAATPSPSTSTGRPADGAGSPTAPSPLVSSIQRLLAQLGYDPGTPIGFLSIKTNIAIAAFQKSQGDPGDGLPSETVRAKLERVVAERGAAPPAAAAPPPAKPDAPKSISAVSTGTGFYIAPDTLITNFHVVKECVEMRIRKNGAERGSARVIAVSQSDDLATLHTDVVSHTILKLRVGAPIKPAEAVLVFGYPLAGALSSTGNTTLGNVTSLTGLNDDSRYIQISASVQPGNSGGPAVDDSGRLMGVVVSKLNALAVAKATGDIPQNVNFAIKVSVLVNFLEAHNIGYQADSATHEMSNTQRAEQTEAGSTQLECWK